jgi:hypothetical protein
MGLLSYRLFLGVIEGVVCGVNDLALDLISPTTVVLL